MAIDSAAATSIASLYIGFYDRAPDPVGLNYWIGRLDAGVSLTDIAESFAASPEAAATYPYIKAPNLFTPDQMINQVYQNIFGRDADADGLKYYSDRIDGGESVGSVLASIIGNAATNDAGEFPDQGVLANKVEVGLNWAEQAGLAGSSLYEADGETPTAAAKASAAGVIDGVDATEASVDAANQEIADYFANGGNGTVGDTFTLTTAQGEQIHGTDGNDTINGSIAGLMSSRTFNNFDNVDGGKGTDTFNLIGNQSELPASTTVSNVEIFNLIRPGAAIGTLDASGYIAAGAEQIWQVNSSVAVTELAEGVVAGFKDGNVSAVTGDDAATSVAVALDKVDNAGHLVVDGGDDLTTVSVSGSVGGAGHLFLDLMHAGTTDLTLAFTSDVELQIDAFPGAATLEHVDASGSTGGIETSTSSGGNDVLELESVVGGSGNDHLMIQLGDFKADALTLDGGAGNDVFTIETDDAASTTAVAVSITLGAGNDTVQVDGDLGNIITATTSGIQNGLVTITDFSASNDVLNFSTMNGDYDGLDNTELGNVADATSLLAAATLAATYLDNTGDFTAFDWGGDMYVLADTDAGSTFTAGDGLIHVVGMSVEDISAANFLA